MDSVDWNGMVEWNGQRNVALLWVCLTFDFKIAFLRESCSCTRYGYPKKFRLIFGRAYRVP